MSLATRCPACATTFKVVRDQLRISDGWVRCGRCSEVFDATLELHELDGSGEMGEAASVPAAIVQPADAAPSTEAARDAAAPALVEEDLLDDEPPADPADAETDASPPLPGPPNLPSLPGATGAPPLPRSLPPFPAIDLTLTSAPAVRDAASMPAWVSSSVPVPVATGDDHVAAGHADAEADADAGTDTDTDTDANAAAEADSDADAAAADDTRLAEADAALSVPPPSAPMVRAASEPDVFHDPFAPALRRTGVSFARHHPHAARGALIAMAGVAAALLVAQVLRHERDAVAARQPGLRPVLETLCRWTGCELSALRRIGEITIDGASFARERDGDAYRLSFTLRNAAAVPLAMPAVELSLLDTQEQAVVRRVLRPDDFGAPAVLPAHAEQSVSLPLAIAGPGAEALPPVAGYRMVAFYP